MSTYKYDIGFDYVDGEGDPVHVNGENVLALVIDYEYDSEAIQPAILMKARLDKNFIDRMIRNKVTARIHLQVYKTRVDVDQLGSIRTPYIITECVYDIPEDVKEDSTILYDRTSDKKDVYGQISIAMLSNTIIERNTVNNDLIIKNCNMMGAVCFFTSHMPMVIEPFTYNDMIDQLIIEPQETIKSMIRYLNNIKVFYDTPLRYYMDFNATYLLSSSGIAVPVEGEQSSTVVISVKDTDTHGDTFELGVNYNKDANFYELKVLSNDVIYTKDNATNKVANKLVGILDPGREQSNPGLSDIEKMANNFMKDISDAVTSMIPGIGGGINSVVHGKNVMDYNTYRVEYHSSRYYGAAMTSESRQTESLDAHYEAAKKAASSSSSSGSSGSSSHKDDKYSSSNSSSSGGSADKIYKDGTKIVSNLDTSNEIGGYLEELYIGQEHYASLESKSIETGYGITSYENLINGVRVKDIHRNLEAIAAKKDVNMENTAFVAEQADYAKEHEQKSFEMATDSIKASIKALKENIENCNKLWKMAKKNSSSSGSGNGNGGDHGGNGGDGHMDDRYYEDDELMRSGADGSGGSGSNEAGGMTEEEHNRLMGNLEDSLAQMEQFQAQFDQYYGLMNSAVDDGVQYGGVVTQAQVNINPLSDGLTGLGDALSQIGDLIGSVTDIADSIGEFSDNLSESISKVASEGLQSMGIGNIAQIMNGGIESILNLVGVGKTGISFLETGIFGLLDGGGEKIKYVNLDNDNPNKIKGIQRALELKGNVLTLTKDNIDNSIITLNKEYIVNNTLSRTEQNGRYLLGKKQEIYIREGALFVCKTIMEFKKI